MPKVPFDSSEYEVIRSSTPRRMEPGSRCSSPKKGLKRDGTRRLLMIAYGGFHVNLLPDWNPEYAWWMEQGGFFAMPNLRGGGEYGEQWHKAGMFEHKQNVFDDFFAAAQYLIDEQVHFAEALRHPRPLERRPADGRRHDPASGNVWRHLVRVSAARHAALSRSSWSASAGPPNTDRAENEKQFPTAEDSPYQNVKPGRSIPRSCSLPATAIPASILARAQDDGPHAGRRWRRPSDPAALPLGWRPQRRGIPDHSAVTDQADELAFL